MFQTRHEIKKQKLKDEQEAKRLEKEEEAKRINEENETKLNEKKLIQDKIDNLDLEIKEIKNNIINNTDEFKILKRTPGKKSELKTTSLKNDIQNLKLLLDDKNKEIKELKRSIKLIQIKAPVKTKIIKDKPDNDDDKFDKVIVKLLEDNSNDIDIKCQTIHNDKKIIKNIVHLADIHIRLSALHHEYQIVFNTLYDNLNVLKNKDPDTLIVICGDILHSKDELKPDTVVMVWNFLKSLSDIFPVIIISGNHDMIQNNNNKIDSITSILKDRPIKSIHYLLNSGVYIYNNIIFGVSSLIDNYILTRDKLDTLIDKLDYEDKYIKKIGLYHGQVGNVKIGTDNMILNNDSEEVISLNKFGDYDYILLGDIHKFQYLNKEKTIAYSGSLISQNFSETDDYHGYLYWNILTGGSNYVKIHNDNAYHKINLEEIIDINNEIVKEKFQDIKYSGYLRIDINEMLFDQINTDKIKKQINLINPNLKLSFKTLINNYKVNINSDTVSEEKEEIESNVNKLLKQYINDVYGITDNRLDIILNEFKKLISECNTDKNNIEYETGKWKILWLAFDDMYGYGKNNFIDFTKYSEFDNEIVGIFGENSYGKSSLIDIITYMLYYRSARDSHNVAPKDIINVNCNKSTGVLIFESNHTKYLIKRVTYRKDTKGGKNRIECDLDFHKLIKVDNNEVLHKSEVFTLFNQRYKKISLNSEKTKTEIDITKIIGTYENFIYTSVLLQSNNKTFKSKSPIEKKELLCTLLNINHFNNIESEVHKRFNQYKDRYNHLINDSNKISEKSLDELINESKHIQDTILTDLNKTSNNYKQEIQSLYDNIRKLSCKIHNVKSNIKTDDELKIKMRSLNNNEERLVKIDNQLINVNNQINKLSLSEDNDKKKKKLFDKIKSLTNDKLSLKLTEIDKDIKLDQQQILLDKHQELLNIHNNKDEISKLTFEIDNIEDKINKLKKSDNSEIKNKIVELTKEKKEIQLYPIDSEYNDYNNNLSLLENIENDMNNNFDLLESKDTIINNYNNLISSNTAILDDTFIKLKKNISKTKFNVIDTNNLIDTLIDTVNLLLNRNIKEHNFITKYNEVNKLNNEYNDLTNQRKNILKNNRLIKKNNKLITSIENIDNELYQLNNKLLEQEKNEINYNREKLSLSIKIDEINKYKLDLDNKIKENKRNIKILKKNNDIIELISLIDNQIDDLEIKLDKIIKEQKLELSYKTEINNITYERNNLLNIINELKRDIDDYTKDKDSITNNNKINNEIELIQNEINKINSLLDNVNSEILMYNTKNANLLKDIERINQNKILIDEVFMNFEIYKVLYEITGKNGFQTYLLSKSLDSINTRINNILEPFINKTILLSLQDDKKYVNIDMDIITKEGNIETLSGMETFMIDLVFKIILSNISHLPSSSLLFIDEGISVLDKNRLAAIDELFSFLKTHYNTIFIITHIKNVKDFIDHSIEITKKNNKSTIISHYNNKFHSVLEVDNKEDDNDSDEANKELNETVITKKKIKRK